jgi:hypothetical protein
MRTTPVNMTVMLVVLSWYGVESAGMKAHLHVLENGKMTGERYRDDILDLYLRPNAGAVGPESSSS